MNTKHLLIFITFFYAGNSLAENFYFYNPDKQTARNEAYQGCASWLRAKFGADTYINCPSIQNAPTQGIFKVGSPHSYPHRWIWSTLSCPENYYVNENNQCIVGNPPKTDEQCLAEGDKLISYKVQKAGEPLKICIGSCDIEFEQCRYESYRYGSDGYKKPECFYDLDDEISCKANNYPLGAANGNSSITGDDSNSTNIEKKDAQTQTSLSSTPETINSDTPNIGDTQKTQSTTETTQYTDSQEIDIVNENLVIKTTSGGDIEKTTATTTTTYSDGSVSVDVVTTYSQTPITQTQEKANLKSGAISSTSETTPSTTGSTTNSSFTATDGSTTSTTTNTGSGGSGSGTGDDRSEYGEEFGDFTPYGSSDALYTSEENLSFESTIQEFKDSVFNSNLVSSATSFFDVSISGSCPVWTIPAVWVFPAIVIDMQCSQTMNDIWPYISAVILLSASFLAFRWGFL